MDRITIVNYDVIFLLIDRLKRSAVKFKPMFAGKIFQRSIIRPFR
ncbi:hypothetical protein [Sulfurisphaera ohwakuensis]